MRDVQVLNRHSYSIPNATSGSPFTVVQDTDYPPAPVGAKYYAFYVDKNNSNVWAECIVTQTNATTITVNRVERSSGSFLTLPSVGGEALIFACNPSKEIQLEQAGGFDIILAFGQSNMKGHNTGAFDKFKHTTPDIMQLPSTGTYQDQIVPIWDVAIPAEFVSGGITDYSFSIANTFAKKYRRYIGNKREVMLLANAWDGVAFENHWGVGNPRYTAMINRVTTIMNDYPGSRVVAAIGHLGEGDVLIPVSKVNEKAYIAAFSNGLRTTIPINEIFTAGDRARLPIILGGMQDQFVTDQGANGTAVQEALAESQDDIQYNGFVSAVGLAHKGDSIHFTEDALDTLGSNYFDLWVDIWEGNISTGNAVAPGAFGSLTLANLEPFEARVTAATVTGSPAPLYAAQRNINNTGWNEVADGLGSPDYTFTGLTENLAHEARFRAYNTESPDSFSAALPFTTEVAVAPGTFGALTQDSLAATSASYSWAAVTGNPTPEYTVWLKVGAGSFTEYSTRQTATSVNLTGLADNTAHQIYIEAINDKAPNTVSSTENFTTPALPVYTEWLDLQTNVGVSDNGTTITWADQSGNGRDFTATNASRPTDGGVNGLNFTSYAMTISTAEDIPMASGHTRILKVKTGGTTTGNLLTSNGGCALWVTTNKLSTGASDNYTVCQDPGTLSTNTEYKIAVTQNASGDWKMYRWNGVSLDLVDSTTASTVPTPTQPLYLGGLNPTLFVWQGDILAVKVYAEEIPANDLETIISAM